MNQELKKKASSLPSLKTESKRTVPLLEQKLEGKHKKKNFVLFWLMLTLLMGLVVVLLLQDDAIVQLMYSYFKWAVWWVGKAYRGFTGDEDPEEFCKHPTMEDPFKGLPHRPPKAIFAWFEWLWKWLRDALGEDSETIQTLIELSDIFRGEKRP
jgi:hypothetical protein